MQARFIDPTLLAKLGNLQLVAKTVVEGVHPGDAPFSLPRVQPRFRRVPAVCAGRRHPDGGLESLREDRPLLREEVRRRHQHPTAHHSGQQPKHVIRRQRSVQVGLRPLPGGFAGLSCRPPERRHRIGRLRFGGPGGGAASSPVPAFPVPSPPLGAAPTGWTEPDHRISGPGLPLHPQTEHGRADQRLLSGRRLLSRALHYLHHRGNDVVLFHVLDPANWNCRWRP